MVFCDADNQYLPGWLEGMVGSFADDSRIDVLTGQTSVRCIDLMSTLFALTFFFPPFKPDRGLEVADTYFGNNSAFRRRFLLEHPIDFTLPLLRGNDYVHSFWLRQGGFAVWRQTRSRAYHAAPETLRELILRYLARGSDRLEIWKRTRGLLMPGNGGRGPLTSVASVMRILRENVEEFLSRVLGVARQSPGALVYLPLALPLGMGLMAVVVLGVLVSYFRPRMLVDRYLDAYHSADGGAARIVSSA